MVQTDRSYLQQWAQVRRQHYQRRQRLHLTERLDRSRGAVLGGQLEGQSLVRAVAP